MTDQPPDKGQNLFELVNEENEQTWGMHVKSLEGERATCVHIVPMLTNYRIVRLRGCLWPDQHFFCYPRREFNLIELLGYALEWTGENGTAPEGKWVKGNITENGRIRKVRNGEI